MSKEESLVPHRRFKEFQDAGAWGQHKLGELANIVRGASPRPIKDPKWFDESSDIGWLRISDVTEQNGRVYHLSQHISKLGEIKTRVLTEPHILLSIAATVGKPLINYCKTGVHDGFLIFQSPHFNLEFMFQWLTSFEHKWRKFGQPGSQVNLNSDIVKNQIIYIPSVKEQEEIGKYLSKVDNLITLHQRKLNKLKKLKSAYLIEMFPAEGKRKPKRRFAGFTDDWEQRKFKDILKTYSFRPYLADISENGEYEVIQQGDKPIIGYSDGEPFMDYKDITLFGDHTVSLYKPQRPFFVATDGVKILSADKLEGDYLYTSLERYKPEPQGYKRHFTILKNQIVWFTENIEEQRKIGEFFKQLSHLITLHQRKIDKLEKLKAAYLNEMFV